ncbi:aspartate aminotransferase family protein [Nonomuraea typhae]|uniref:Aspartate aminotransferase family protein n=1 Tax=Nonomuraea typhae TaxID=2603600 RepID=A0ABW7ZCI5_9ACTN
MNEYSVSTDEITRLAADHLWLHFTPLSDLRNGEVPVIVRGEGCYLEDSHGHRYLDALAGLFAVNIGYGYGGEMGQAALDQLRQLPYHTNWGYMHPRSVELAAEIAGLAPDGLNRVFFVSGGSEAVEAAWKLAREYHSLRGERRWKVIARHIAYHGTTMGALSITGLPECRTPFEPLVPSVTHVSNTVRYRRPPEETEAQFTAFLLAELEAAIEREGPETVAMMIIEPIQNAGGAIPPPAGYLEGVREITRRHGILLCADEVICGFGRLGAWFGSELYGIQPDLITCAKGLSSAYGTIGALIVGDRVAEPFLNGKAMFDHGMTFGGHPLQSALALKNLEIMRRDRIVEHVSTTQGDFHATLSQLLDLDIVGDLRGSGFFWALELVKDSGTRETFSQAECDWLLRDFLAERLLEAGLICRSDDRGDPVVQISPPLVATQEQFDEITGILGDVLSEAQDKLKGSR